MIAARHTMFNAVGMKIPDGTTFIIKTNTNTRILDISSLVKVSDSESIKVNWGDGSPVETYTSSASGLTHTYGSNDFFMVNISDDVSSIKLKNNTERRVVCYGCSFGSKITTIQNNCFQNMTAELNSANSYWCGLTTEEFVQGLHTWTDNRVLTVNATSIGQYSFFLWARNVRFTNIVTLSGPMFYAEGLRYAQNLTFDSLNTISNVDLFTGYSAFVNDSRTGYGYKTITFTNKTISQIQSMSNYPWQLTTATIPIDIFGTDGVIHSGSTT